ncbi:hypothetical protein [Streptomyces sp. NPDC050428]|uniref:hypothetical protein n=1 Tax=Streptomyces sp. NPDC050428 TaxID=3155757 RepID=UPI003429FECC
MRPFPPGEPFPCTTIVLNPETQMGQWLDETAYPYRWVESTRSLRRRGKRNRKPAWTAMRMKARTRRPTDAGGRLRANCPGCHEG